MKLIALLFVVIIAVFMFPSCSGIMSGITGQPVPTVQVQRIGGSTPFNVAAADVAQAETQPEKAWGLYDTKAVADSIGQVFTSSK